LRKIILIRKVLSNARRLYQFSILNSLMSIIPGGVCRRG